MCKYSCGLVSCFLIVFADVIIRGAHLLKLFLGLFCFDFPRPDMHISSFEITALLSVCLMLEPLKVVPLEPLAVTHRDVLILSRITNRCLREDLSLCSALHKGFSFGLLSPSSR